MTRSKTKSKSKSKTKTKSRGHDVPPVLVFELGDVSATLLDGFDRRWDQTPLRFFLARRDQDLFGGLAKAVPEQDHPLAMEAVELLSGPILDACLDVAAETLAIEPEEGELRFASFAFVGDVDAASAWLREHGANLIPFEAIREIRDPEQETLQMALERVGGPTPSPAQLERRQACLQSATSTLTAARRWFKKHLGLRLPRHLAVFHALCESLGTHAKQALPEVGFWPYGIMRLFSVIERGPKVDGGHDPRLIARWRRDPPEMVTVASGDQDGEHFGLWYDDPSSFPTAIACNFSRDSAETELVGATVIEVLAKRMTDRFELEPPTKGMLALAEAVAWFIPHDEAAKKKDRITTRIDHARVVGTPAPAFDLQSERVDDHDKRGRAYARAVATKRGRSKTVDRWIDEARAELDRGAASFAWILGHELHWLDADGYREDATSLLAAAYAELGHTPFAQILQTHVAHRDLDRVPLLK